MKNDFFKHILLSSGSRQNRIELETETLPYTFTSNSHRLRNYRIYGNTVNGESVGDLVTEGEHTGNYLIPVTINSQTTNLYLPHPLRKIGDYADYVDFREQKQHSKKNLLNIELMKGSFNIIDGKPTIVQNRVRSKNNDYFLPAGTYTLNANGADDCVVYRYSTQSTDDYALSESVTAWQSLPYTFTTSEGFYTMFGFRRSDNANIEPSDVTDIQLEKGSTATDYEAPNESVELDISLPALPTLSDTNTITFGTTVQPSKIWIQGNISEIETVSAEPVQANVQSLQPLSLDENAELDVMPSDKNEFQTNDISEMPVEDENSIEEILETENLETTGDDENAE